MSVIKSVLVKLYQALIVSPYLATLTMFFDPLKTILLTETDFFTILAAMLTLDIVIGVMKYLKLRKFSFRYLVLGLITKVAVCYGGIFMFLLFSSLEDGPVAQWFLLVGKFTILLYPAGSIFANMYVLSNGRFPPIKLMKYLEAFDQLSVPMRPAVEKIKDGDTSENK